MVILKPLYRIAEAGTYWWATYSKYYKEKLLITTYSKYYKEKLLITTFIFNPCFLITTIGTPFRIVGMQTNNIIILGDN